MILIADSGSSKTDWILIANDKKISHFNTIGLNPYFTDALNVSHAIQPLISNEKASQIKKVYFYGAGCSNSDKCEIIKSGIQLIIKNADVSIYSDLLGAARALFKSEKGIAVILGTGSNAGYYNGKEISKSFGSFGYILGDEGSGANLGLSLIKSYLNNNLPKNISEKFKNQYKISNAEILENVYKKPNPNKYFASYSVFIKENINDDYIFSLVYNLFLKFFLNQISKYEKNEIEKIRFTGSVSYHFQDILLKVASHLNFKVDLINQKPIIELANYHTY